MGDGTGHTCKDCGEWYGNYDYHGCDPKDKKKEERMTSATATKEPEQLKLRTTRVRVRITQRDLDKHRTTLYRTDHEGAVVDAINRVLKPGYAATFDGLSVGVLRTHDSSGDPLYPGMGEQGAHVYDGGLAPLPSALRYKGTCGTRFRLTDDGTAPFFRGVSKRVQKIHQQNVAHRKTKPARVTISLPDCALKRTEGVTTLDATFND